LYSRYLIGQGAGGEQMEWLRSDYEDFVEQALIARSIPTLRSVIGGLLGAAKVCINEDDSAALVLFLDLMKYAWQSAKNDDELRTRRSIVRDQVLISLDHLTYESIASSLDGGRKTPGSYTVPLLIKTYSDLMKQSIDDRLPDDLDTVAKHLTEASTYARSLFTDYGHADPVVGSDDQSLVQIVTAALIGVDGWILYLGGQNQVSRDELTLREVLKPYIDRVNSWDALPFVVGYRSSDFFSWTSWELFSSERRSGFLISVGGFIEKAVLISAISNEKLPTWQNLQSSLSDRENVGDLRSVVRELLLQLDQLVDQGSWVEPDAPMVFSLRRTLTNFQEEALVLLSNQLIDRPLSRELLQRFRSTVRAQRLQAHVAQLFPQSEIVLGHDDEQLLDIPRFGVDRLDAKDYFVESDVEADAGRLAVQCVRIQRSQEQSYVLGRLNSFLPSQDSNRQTIVEDVKKRIDLDRLEGRTPVILISGSWIVARLFDVEGEDWTETPPTLLRAGAYHGVAVYWTISVHDQMCFVFDPILVANIDWRRMTSDGSNRDSEDGRLLVEVLPVSREYAQSLGNESGQLTEEEIRRRQETVHVKVIEAFRWSPIAPAGAVLHLPANEDLAY